MTPNSPVWLAKMLQDEPAKRFDAVKVCSSQLVPISPNVTLSP